MASARLGTYVLSVHRFIANTVQALIWYIPPFIYTYQHLTNPVPRNLHPSSRQRDQNLLPKLNGPPHHARNPLLHLRL